ncbi:MAG: PadR family transcriptional regulator [Terracidiphilus sp.]
MAKEMGIWEVAVLALLREAPMHPYQMQRLLRDRHKDELLALKRGSLYHAIGRLVRDELIAASATGREGNRPERTTYRITPEGRRELTRVLRQMVAVPRRESSEFLTAVSFLVQLAPNEALARLEERCQALEGEIAQFKAQMAGAAPHVLRIHLIESEYLVAMLSAELSWARSLAADIRAGRLGWDAQTIFKDVRAARLAARDGKE